MTERQTEYVEEAVSRPDTEFSMDELEAAEAHGLDRIFSQLNAQSDVQRNADTPQPPGISPDGTPELYISDSGFEALFGAPPRILYTAEGNGALERPADTLVTQVILGSFGYDIDKAVLRTGARSIQVDDVSRGHNPFKVYQRLQQVLFQPRQSTTHLVTRRGDIICCCPWNRAPASPSRRLQDATAAAITIELESWHTTDYSDFRGVPEADFKVMGLIPYTPEQLAALAFILKKLGLWSQSAPTAPLGFTLSEVRPKIGQEPGIIPLSALEPSRDNSPGGEFMLPLGWAYGDPLPPWANTPAWEQRMALLYSDRGTTPVSHYDEVQRIYQESLPVFSVETELFRPVTQTLFQATPSRNRGAAGAADAALTAQGEGFSRSAQMQASLRSGLYSAAPVANAAVVNATEAYATRMGSVSPTDPHVPRIINALGFNFETGAWETTAVTTIDAGELPEPQQG
jgi:hypothetical protein